MNKLAIVAAGLLLFFGAMLWFLASADLNGFIRSQIETHGSQVLGEPVTVDSVDLQLSEGFGGIYGVSFSNPSQFGQPKAFYLGEVSLDLDISSFGQSPLVIESITLNKPQAFVEFDQNGKTNVEYLLNAIKRNTSTGSGDAEQTKPEPQKKSSDIPETRIAIEKLTLAGVALTLDLSKVNGKIYDIEIPEVELGAIGGEQGVAVSELAGVVSTNVFKAIAKAAKKQYKKALKQQFNDKLDEKKEAFLEKLKTK
ncbi:hypothetical protein [Thalassotalea sp. ND16A]|uniref:hypothetical protein n=1 Tax=Thalassotalea sp. ND16A TaxID=1535422 RepID=UPI00051A6532|nr:hypothetical protein [Thalassotalea sp. ND16A]KGJ99141.1 hypothetical protein ND16A_3905 [Thalassotalea sp. ND16A]